MRPTLSILASLVLAGSLAGCYVYGGPYGVGGGFGQPYYGGGGGYYSQPYYGYGGGYYARPYHGYGYGGGYYRGGYGGGY
jgi:hypothetical protein